MTAEEHSDLIEQRLPTTRLAGLVSHDKRILWMLNHTTLREGEVPLLVHAGFEVYCPKRFPVNSANRSASVSFAFDSSLSIPPTDIEALNRFDFYSDRPTPEIRRIINEYFGTAIIAYMFPMFDNFCYHFKGRILLRAFGVTHPSWTYYSYARVVCEEGFERRMARISERFWFAQAYPNLKEIEPRFIQERTLDLPVGLPTRITKNKGTWQGGYRKILFVCPDIKSYEETNKIYEKFKKFFGDLPHVICGAQTIPVDDDPCVVGRVNEEEYDRLFRECQVMFYHSELPRHLHYHPVEAICYGMPLIYMDAGMLGKLAGKQLPGACETWKEARKKVRELLSSSKTSLLQEVVHSQVVLDDYFSFEHNLEKWNRNFIAGALSIPLPKKSETLRIAILSIDVSLQSARLAFRSAQAIVKAAFDMGEKIECRVGVPASLLKSIAPKECKGIRVCAIEWEVKSREQIRVAQRLQGFGGALRFEQYLIPEDDVSQFMDCQSWLLVGEPTATPIAPVKPQFMLIAEYGWLKAPATQPALVRQVFASYLSTALTVFTTNKRVKELIRNEYGLAYDWLIDIGIGIECDGDRGVRGDLLWKQIKDVT